MIGNHFLYGIFLQFRTPKFLTKWRMQTVQTQIKLLLKEQSDQGLPCLPCHLKKKKMYKKAEFSQKVWNKVFKILGHLS